MASPKVTPPIAKRPRIAERTMLACIGCKQRKLKCDGQSPKCQTCIKTGRECLVEDPATGIHRPRDYLKSLEERVAYLESLLQQVRPDVAMDHLDPAGSTPSATQPPLTSELSRLPATSMLNHDDSALAVDENYPALSPSKDQQVDVLSSEVALLCLSATGRDPHYFGPSSAVSFSRIVSATMGIPANSIGSGFQPSTMSGREAPPTDRPSETSLLLPSPATAANLTKAYFNNIHPQYPILHRPTFESWQRDLNSLESASETGDINIPLFFVLMVYSVGSLVLRQNSRESAEKYYAAALDHLPPILELNNLESIQGILACAVYSIRSPIGVSLWKVSGMAIRHCIELGYHRSTELHPSGTDLLTKEMIKRCFWVAYDIDRVAAFTLGRPVGIPEDSIDVELPADTDDEDITTNGFSRPPRTSMENPPTTMTGALHVIKLRRLWARFNGCLYSKSPRSYPKTQQMTAVEILRRELEQWRSSLPTQLEFAHSNPLSVFASTEWFRLAYDHSILLLYRPLITTSKDHRHEHSTALESPGMTEMIDHAFEECAKSAREMCLLYRRLYQSSSVQFTWGSLHILFLGGLTYLYCLWRSKRVRDKTRQMDIVSTCLACSTVLVIIAERWNLATSYRDLFETLSERTISMVCGDWSLPDQPREPAPENNTEQPILHD